MLAGLLAAGSGILLFCLIVLLFGGGAAEGDRVRRRLNEISREGARPGKAFDDEMSKPLMERFIKPTFQTVMKRVSSFLPVKRKNPGDDKQKIMLQQAGWTISVEEYKAIQMVAMAVCGGLGIVLGVISKREIIYWMLYFLGGAFGAYAVMRYSCAAAGTKRRKSMENQLPDMLDLLSVSVAAGLGFERAMLHICETMDGPLIDEFAVAYREMSMGRTRKDALTLLGQRCGVEDLSSVTSAIVQAGQLGIPIRNVLHSQAAAIRRSRRNKVQEKAAKVSTKILLPMLVFIFPVLFIVLLAPSLITIIGEFK